MVNIFRSCRHTSYRLTITVSVILFLIFLHSLSNNSLSDPTIKKQLVFLPLVFFTFILIIFGIKTLKYKSNAKHTKNNSHLNTNKHRHKLRETTSSTPNNNFLIKNINANFKIHYRYDVLFENQVFTTTNPTFRDTVKTSHSDKVAVCFFIDSGVFKTNKHLCNDIEKYCDFYSNDLQLIGKPRQVSGGESIKTSKEINAIYSVLLDYRLDRHAFVVIIGGGAVLDAIAYACATFHRGIKTVRMPSTVLAQNDAGIGVKNGYNAFDNKNLIGTFSPPFAVINDYSLLQSLPRRERIAGLAEAIKVAAIKDADFFEWMESHISDLRAFDTEATRYAIARCAQLHLQQICEGGDPFESGNKRPLDYGHWCAHKLETMSHYQICHGEAVAIGMALDARYAVNSGLLQESAAQRLINLLANLGFSLYHNALHKIDDRGSHLVLQGIEEFRQHLGGTLSITLLTQIGVCEEVNTIEPNKMLTAIDWLRTFNQENSEYRNGANTVRNAR